MGPCLRRICSYVDLFKPKIQRTAIFIRARFVNDLLAVFLIYLKRK